MGRRKKNAGATTSDGLRKPVIVEPEPEKAVPVRTQAEADLIAPLVLDGETPLVLLEEGIECPQCGSSDSSFPLQARRFKLYMNALMMGKVDPPVVSPDGPWTCFDCGTQFLNEKAREQLKAKLQREIADLEEKVKPPAPAIPL